ncbi:MAG: hypothetical protein QF793_02415 [Candidatus Peribacteraceae bacterium]|jgi:hypothetical protein|nr:hypothetical protein [bacterium]MDP6561757.1 hypothetical protein [Candidatus Peribacteraceae bacterium]|tara:strand:- start:8909 stop:9301 length:393 start_codon:yes stop_codon:yes gene_type:complete
MERHLWLIEEEILQLLKGDYRALVPSLSHIYHTQPMPKNSSSDGDDITLHDVIAHIQNLQSAIRANGDLIKANAAGIQSNADAINHLESSMNSRFEAVDRRFDAVDQDIQALGMDIIAIKQHVRMPVALD